MQKILQSIPIIYAAFLLLGYVNLASYYSNFGIAILEFTEISEMLLSFLGVVSYIVALFVFLSFSFILALFVPDFLAGRKKNKKKVKIKSSPTASKANKVMRFIFNDLLSHRNSMIIVTIFLIVRLISQPGPLYDNFGIILLIELFLAFLLVDTVPVIPYKQLILLVGVLFLVFIISFNNYIFAQKVESGKVEHFAEFKVDKKIIKTDKEHIYIGMTKNYLFIREVKTKRTSIYERSKISDLVLTSAKAVEIKF